MTDLDKYIAIYIPTKDAKGEDLNYVTRANRLKDVRKEFARAFGGFTEYEAIGGWESNGKVVIEPITIVKSFYSAGSDRYAYQLARTLALVIKTDLKQEAVTIEQNGGLSFI